MRAAAILLVAVLCTALLTACGGGEKDDAPGQPPGAVLSSPSGTRVQAVIGAYCWDGFCSDGNSVVAEGEAEPLGRGAEFRIDFDAGAPDESESAWVPLDEPPASSGAELTWTDLDYTLERDEPGFTSIPDPAVYVFVLRATWENRGEVTYGFYLDRTED